MHQAAPEQPSFLRKLSNTTASIFRGLGTYALPYGKIPGFVQSSGLVLGSQLIANGLKLSNVVNFTAGAVSLVPAALKFYVGINITDSFSPGRLSIVSEPFAGYWILMFLLKEQLDPTGQLAAGSVVMTLGLISALSDATQYFHHFYRDPQPLEAVQVWPPAPR